MDSTKLKYTDINDSKTDVYNELLEKVRTWPLMGSPLIYIFIMGIYLTFVLKIGPDLMKKRAPYNITKLMVTYNAIMVASNSYLAYSGFQLQMKHGFVYRKCIFMSDKIEGEYMLKIGYCYAMTKVLELLDTVFFVLRKKQNQVTFLHLYHHTIMLIAMCIGLMYTPNESLMFMASNNSLVHVIMYSYYALSAFPSISKYLSWKKYITKLQLIQFIAAGIHMLIFQSISDCPLPKTLVILYIFNAVLFYWLFNNFYTKAYVNKTKANQMYIKKKVKTENNY